MTVESVTPDTRYDSTAEVRTATLEDVDILEELEARPTRIADYEREHHAIAVLTTEMALQPLNLLQKLAEIAVECCDAGTAGISLLDGDVFRWQAVAGVFAGARGGTMPRHQSPCGLCIDRNATQLLHLADRCFPALLAEPRFVEALLIPFHLQNKPVGTLWIVSHTSERKFDREDARMAGVLARFASAGWQLWRASEVAAAGNRNKDQFLARLAHELRTPLSAMATAAAILQRRADTPSATHAVAVIARQAQQVSRMVGDLLDIARIESGKLRLERQTVDLRTVVAEAIEARRPQVERRRQILTMELGDDPAWVEADPLRVAQVVSNLVDNAAKYTPEDGRISVVISTEDDHAILKVGDTGVGVSGDRVEGIFEPFMQVPESSGGFSDGLGLGLAIVRSIAEQHGGSVSVASAGAGQGSCFTVRLPIASRCSVG